MTAPAPVSIRMALAGLVTITCAACDAADTAPVSAAPSPDTAVAAQVVDRLPLQPGYYVAADTPCGEASNATIHLRWEDGSGYGGFTTPPYFCEFRKIEQTGPSGFRTTEVCGSHHEGDEHANLSTYDILSDTRYRAKNDDGWESSARRCPRGELPALWRDEDIGDFVD